jgi:AcrR family transcriptional regulator
MPEGPDAVRLSVPRGRHAPPLEVRLSVQRRRLFQAAAKVFARTGYAEASAEAISREAGMSKATFYEHFANKEECILALFDEATTEAVRSMANSSAGTGALPETYEERVRSGLWAFLETLARYPDSAETFLVQIVGAGPRALARRDAVMDLFADGLYRDNARVAPKLGANTFASREDAFACIGAIVELVSRQVRTGAPADIRELAPVLERIVLGVLSQSDK